MIKWNMYGQDIKDAAISAKNFDKVNAKYIAERHGDDPKKVQKDIRSLRKDMALIMKIHGTKF